jgi:tripartite-type tricarboxylate transporter receptor subunit TctC
VTAHIKSGKLRALAVTGPKPSALFPGLPTVAASGVPGYESAASFGLFAPAKTPAPVIARLNQAISQVLNTPDIREKLFNSGMEIVASSPDEFAALLRSEIAKWTKVIQKAGIRDE